MEKDKKIRIVESGSKIYCTSLNIADVLGINHRDLLRRLRDLQASDVFTKHNYILTTYRDANNQKRPMYHISYVGFNLLFRTRKPCLKLVMYQDAYKYYQQQIYHRLAKRRFG